MKSMLMLVLIVFDSFLELGVVKVLRLGVITATLRNILNSFNSDQETCF